MKQVIYKEVIEIDGVEYTVHNCDYSETIRDLIADGVVLDHNMDIVNYIIDDIVNSQ
jgi:hypothetical protein